MFSKLFKGKSKKVTPMLSVRKKEERSSKVVEEEEMRVIGLHTLFKLYGGQKCPRTDSYEVLEERGELKFYRYIPPDATTIYISHEWAGTDHPDPDGTQMYHLLYLLDRLQNGEVSRTDMDAFHSLLYKHNVTTTADDWKRILSSEKTYIWYDGFCVPRSRREDGFRSIPSYIRKCDFMIILTPGCRHFDRIDPRTKRRMNLCYRTYRLRARCVFELFCAFLTTRGGEKARPALLVRSGTGRPHWISPLECQKLAVGTSSFRCCEENHTVIKQCRRQACLVLLNCLIEERACSLFQSKNYAEARFTLCMENHWCRGLIDSLSSKTWRTLNEFKKMLRWDNKHDTDWIDREGFPLLCYASGTDCKELVQAILSETMTTIPDKTSRLSHIRVHTPDPGIVSLGISAGVTPLMFAIIASKPEIVSLLLEHGSDPLRTDKGGIDVLQFAAALGSIDNVTFWLDRFPDWDLEKKNKTLGSVALFQAVYMQPRRLELVKMLLDRGASLNHITDAGSSILTSVCSSEDCDPEVLQLLLKSKSKSSVNYETRAKTLKWRNIHRLARFLTRNKLTKSGLITFLSQGCGSTPLHFAVRRGDVDVVNILLRHGADPTIKNALGKSPVDYCDAFPALRGALKRFIHQNKERGTVSLIRRDSTAIEMKFPMYLVPLDQLHRLYGGKDPRHERIEAHQELKERGELVRWEDLPIDAHIIFLSHEWVGWSHPDPHGIQLKTFLRVMKRLRSGDISRVDMNYMHALLFKTNFVVRAEEWKEILSTAYVWIDWASMPQPSACPQSVNQEKKKQMGTDLGNAVKSIPAYVEKADFVAVVAPGCLHADRRDPKSKIRARICYRTYRNRGWCVLEMFASYLSREKEYPMLLITSREGIPEWISSMDVHKLAVGTSDFTCCQRNHIFGDRVVRNFIFTLGRFVLSFSIYTSCIRTQVIRLVLLF